MLLGHTEPAMCCGCGTCMQVCPANCITMVEDPCGFLFPEVNEEACISCKKCTQVCPVLNHENETEMNHESFAAYAKSPEKRFAASSGGMFGALAEQVLQKGGVVYGAAFDEQLKLKCMCARTVEELEPLYKSKYLQCELGDAFLRIRKDLEAGLSVLYVSTPCYVFALQRFLKKDYENLLTVDFICHGVPSQKLFDLCRAYEEEKKGIEITEFQFRTKKKKGATPHYYRMGYRKNGKNMQTKARLYTKAPFYLGFQKYITLRESCYRCKFSASNRCSDLTIGDFHDVDEYLQGINRFDGISLVTINTEKGKKVWDKVSDRLYSWPLDFHVLYENGVMMRGGTKKPEHTEVFRADLKTKPFPVVLERWLKPHREWKKNVYYAMPGQVRRVMRKIMGIQ